MRGEHDVALAHLREDGGSSPHARGARVLRARRGAVCGIIPACAGSTSGTPPTRAAAGDHPRMRGEHPPSEPPSSGHRGSSPHARGAPSAVLGGRDVAGIIPACAGSTCLTGRRCRGTGDHPRMRGEHPFATPLITDHLGSSPHARGALHSFFIRQNVRGIIPACAGST